MKDAFFLISGVILTHEKVSISSIDVIKFAMHLLWPCKPLVDKKINGLGPYNTNRAIVYKTIRI
jgi:hypothetical protein